MPIYEYNCQACGNVFDLLQKVDDPAPEECASCGAKGTVSRLVSRTSFVLKGGGWYSDLYSSSKKEGGSGSSKSASSESSSSSASTSSTSSGSTGSGGSTPSKS